jgi:hypothetical protein
VKKLAAARRWQRWATAVAVADPNFILKFVVPENLWIPGHGSSLPHLKLTWHKAFNGIANSRNEIMQ